MIYVYHLIYKRIAYHIHFQGREEAREASKVTKKGFFLMGNEKDRHTFGSLKERYGVLRLKFFVGSKKREGSLLEPYRNLFLIFTMIVL